MSKQYQPQYSPGDKPVIRDDMEAKIDRIDFFGPEPHYAVFWKREDDIWRAGWIACQLLDMMAKL